MGVVLLVARLLLATVFVVAGIAKAADPDGSRRAMIGFGIPEKLASLFGRSLPAIEILIAIALIPLDTEWVGAIAASLLLLMFSIAIAVNLARGRTPDCHCFGQLHSEPVGWSTVARNVVLMMLAGYIAVQGRAIAGLSALNWLNDLKAGEIAGLALGAVSVALLAATFAYLRRVLNQHAALVQKIDAMKKVIDEDYAEAPVERQEAAPPPEGLPIGAPAPEFSLASIDGSHVTLDDLLAHGKQLLLLFASPNCFPCETLLPSVKTWERDYDSQLTIALISKGDLKENQVLMAKYEARRLLLQSESQVADEYQAQWTPAAVLVRGDGRIASSIAYGDEAIRALVARTVAPSDAGRKRVLPIKGNGHKSPVIIGRADSLRDLGRQAHGFSLSDLDGNLVSDKDILGQDTLLLFWDPKCSFCQAMSEDLVKWEANPPARAPRLVFVSSGEKEAVRAESSRFNSRFLYDPDIEVSLMFGTNLTPSAVLIDAEGRIASPPTAGKFEILLLAGVRKSTAPVGSVHPGAQQVVTR